MGHMDGIQDRITRGRIDTSQAAFDFLHRTGGLHRTRLRVYEYVLAQGMAGATCDETEIVLEMSHQTCSSACFTLNRHGYLYRTAHKRPTRSLREAYVYRALPPEEIARLGLGDLRKPILSNSAFVRPGEGTTPRCPRCDGVLRRPLTWHDTPADAWSFTCPRCGADLRITLRTLRLYKVEVI